MTANFFAILREGEDTLVRRVRVSKQEQEDLTTEFQRQADEFLTHKYRPETEDGAGRAKMVEEDSERIELFPVFTITDHSKVFEIDDFPLEDVIAAAARKPESAHPLILNDDVVPQLRAVFAVFPDKKTPKIVFQSFDRRKVLTQTKWVFMQDKELFNRLKTPGFTLGDTAQAVYEDGNLLFRSYSVVARFLILTSLFTEASNKRVTEILTNTVFHVDDLQSVLGSITPTMRRQFAAISQTGVLDGAKPAKLKEAADGLDIDLKLVKDGKQSKVQFPASKSEQKELLQFLSEGRYRGPISGVIREANSHRPYKKKMPKPKG